MRRTPVAAILILTFVLLVSIVATSWASAEASLPIRIGYQSTPDWLLVVAKDQKLFEKAGLVPTYVKFVAGPPMIPAAQNGSIDVASVGSVPFLLGLSQGVDWTMIGINPEGAYSEGIVACGDCGIRTLNDLKGKRIAYTKGSTAHYGLMMILRQIGIRLDQVTLLDMRPAEQVAALKDKKIDAAIVWEPWLQKMIHQANGSILATEGDMGIYTNVDVYSVRRDWLRDNRETAVRFLRALVMAYDVLQRDPTAGLRAMAEEMEIEEIWAETIYRNDPPPKIYLWSDPRYRYSLVKDSAFHRRLKFLSQFMFDEHLIPDTVDVSKAMDASVITQALRPVSGESGADASATTALKAAQRTQPTQPPKQAVQADRTQVEVFSWWTTGREAAGLQKLIDQFNSENSKAEVVNAAATGMSSAMTVLKTRMLGGDPPDSFQVHMGRVFLDAWVVPGHMEPLDDVYTEYGLNQALPKAVLDIVSYDGHPWSVPVNIHRANMLWYSETAFQKAGINNAPRTWDEFFAAAEKLKSVGITPLALGNKESWPAAHLLEMSLLSTLGPEGFEGLWTGATQWNDPRVTEALNTLRRALSYVNSDYAALNWDQATDLLIDNKAAMTMMGDWAYGELVSKKFTHFGWANAPGTTKIFDALSDTFGLSKGAKHRDLAKKFLGILGSKQGQETFNELKGSICARIDCDYSSFDAYLQWSAVAWKKDTIVPSAVHGAAAEEGWTAAFIGAVDAFVTSKDVARTQEALIKAAADGMAPQTGAVPIRRR